MGQWQNHEGVNESLMIDTCSRLSLSPAAFCVAFAMVGTKGIALLYYCCSLEMTHITSVFSSWFSFLSFGTWVPLQAGSTHKICKINNEEKYVCSECSWKIPCPETLKLKIFSNFFIDGLQERKQNRLSRNTCRGKPVVCYLQNLSGWNEP